MAPATSAGATPGARNGRPGRWTRDDIIEAIKEWTVLYGEPPRAADWNPSAARWSAATWRIARYRRGRPDGSPWPSLNSAKALFDGSLNAALIAAGYRPNKPGPKRRSEVNLELLDRTEMAPAVRAALDAARADARAERARREAADRAQAEVENRVAALRSELRDTRARRPAATATKTKVIRERSAAKAGIARARTDAAEARRAATRAAAKLERAEATISTLRGERRDLRAERARAEDRLASAEASLAAARVRIENLRNRQTVVRVPAPETAVVERARAEADAIAARAAEAEERAALAERRYTELTHAATGGARQLTATEIESLRADGPAGPAVLADAIGELARARRHNNPHRLRKALSRVASAAISWKERL